MTRRLALWAFAALAVSCGPPSVRQTSYGDPEVSCPGGRSAWVLEVVDQRVDREGSEKMVAAIRDGIQKSFPGCRWTAGPATGSESIRIEVHRFASHLEYDREGTGSWEAAADWTVLAVSASGGTLTEFQATEESSRPNYRNYDNEKESLSEVYQKALERTVKGLRSVPANGAVRLLQGTPAPVEAAGGAGPEGENSRPVVDLAGTGAPRRESRGLERKSLIRGT